MASAGEFLGGFMSVGRTRLELLTVEVQLEIRRAAEVAVLLMVAIQAAMIGLIMTAFWVVLVFWESHRLLAAGLAAGFFLAVAAGAALFCLYKIRSKPPMLEGTLSELARDAEQLRGGG